jgi:hypothetical protein
VGEVGSGLVLGGPLVKMTEGPVQHRASGHVFPSITNGGKIEQIPNSAHS